MRRSLSVMMVLVVLTGGTAALADVIGWWRMEDVSGATAADSSAYGYNGTLVNFADTSAGAGNTTQSGWADALVSPLAVYHGTVSNAGSLRLDGSNDYVQTTLPLSLLATGFTIEGIVTCDDAAAPWGWVVGETSGNYLLFGKQSGSGTIHYNIAGMTSRSSLAPSGGNLADGQPHHIALVFDDVANTLKVYWDYAQIDSVTNTGNPTATTNARLGSRSDGYANEKWDGKFDEVRIWNEPVSPGRFLNNPAQQFVSHADNFESGSANWGFRQNATAPPNHVGIIPDPANPSNNVLQVISVVNNLATSAILQKPAWIDGFTAQFRFRVPAGNGADGMTFGVFDSPTFLGGLGWGLGYQGGAAPSFAVEFDTYQDGAGAHSEETNENHVEVDRRYSLFDYTGPTPGSTRVPPFDLENGLWTYAKVYMDNGYLSVWLNQTGFNFTDADRLISADYLGDIDGNGNGRYDPFVGYFGFTGGTGGLNDQFIVDDLYIKMVPEPGTLALLGLGALGVIRRRGGK